MARRKRGFHLILGILVGLMLGWFLQKRFQSCWLGNSFVRTTTQTTRQTHPLSVIGLHPTQSPNNSRDALLFVGVMTTKEYLGDRARAVWETWGKRIPGRLAFFSSAGSYADQDIPLISLPGVDDRYPPQKKSFMMLAYMYEHYVDRFEWFLRADDDVYVRTDKLERLLRSVDSRKPQFIGQAGRGTQAELGRLSLGSDENFCMGGPGVLFSRETLRRVGPHVRDCLAEMYSTHEDVEIGRCVRRYAGIPCTWSYEMQSILHHNSSGIRAFSGNLKTREVHRAISLHPVKRPPLMYRLHAYVIGLNIQQEQQQRIDLHKDIMSMASELQVPTDRVMNLELTRGVPLFSENIGHHQYLGDSRILGVKQNLNRFYPRKTDGVLTWEFISKSLYSDKHSNPKRRMEAHMREGLNDVVREVMENINTFSRQRGRIIDFRELLYGYQRLDPIHGHDMILDLLLVYKKYRGRKMTVPVRRHAYIQRSFTDIEIREIYTSSLKSYTYLDFPMTGEYETDSSYNSGNLPVLSNPSSNNTVESGNKINDNIHLNIQGSVDDETIHFILPLSGRFDTFKRFMSVFEDVCLKNNANVALYVSLFKNLNSSADFNKTIKLINDYKTKYKSAKLKYKPEQDAEFSRAYALQIGAKECDANSLLLFIDVDMIFNTRSLWNVRMNTIQYKQFYFPIVFSEYNPLVVYDPDYNIDSALTISNDCFYITERSGYFRQFGYGIVSLYKSDLDSIGGLNSDIKGWGLEDVQLFDKCVSSNMTIFRSADSNFIHIYHTVECDSSLDKQQYKMCLGTKSNTYANYEQLVAYVRKHINVIKYDNTNNKSIS